jgi:hypothetical protein
MNLKTTLSAAVSALLFGNAPAQYKVVSINAVGTSNPQSFCQVTNSLFDHATASFSGTEFSCQIYGGAFGTYSEVPAPYEVETVVGEINWTIQYTGASSPGSVLVKLQANGNYILHGSATDGASGYVTYSGDLADGPQSVINPGSAVGSNTAYSYVGIGSWVEVSSGVWQATSADLSINLSGIESVSVVTSGSSAGSTLDPSGFTAKVISVNGQTVTGG